MPRRSRRGIDVFALRTRACQHDTVRSRPAAAQTQDLKTSLAEKSEMTQERKPVAFGDLRSWMKALKTAGELREVDAEVDWNIELGTIMRLAQGPGTGPALLFNNIKDYSHQDSRCRKVFGCGLSSYRRVAMMLGLSPDTHPRELVKIGRNILTGSIPPKIVNTG